MDKLSEALDRLDRFVDKLAEELNLDGEDVVDVLDALREKYRKWQ